MSINESNKKEIKHLNQYERKWYTPTRRYTNIKGQQEVERNGECPSLGYQYHVEKRVCPNLGYRCHVGKMGYATV